MKNCLKFINRVEMIEADKLSSSIFIQGVGVYLETGLSFQKLETVGLSSLEISDTIQNKNRLFSQKLTSYLSAGFDVANRKFCFLVTAISGEQYLIGTSSRPYPMVTFTDSRPDSVSSKCAVTMLVTYSNTSFCPILGV